jgi:hypothetical protein
MWVVMEWKSAITIWKLPLLTFAELPSEESFAGNIIRKHWIKYFFALVRFITLACSRAMEDHSRIGVEVWPMAGILRLVSHSGNERKSMHDEVLSPGMPKHCKVKVTYGSNRQALEARFRV